MRKLDELSGKVGDITPGNAGEGILFGIVQGFFSRSDVQRKMIELNQKQLFEEESGRDGSSLGIYKPATARMKMRQGLPSSNYTFYEKGSFFSSMGVKAGKDSVEITSSGNGLMMDAIGHWGVASPIEMGHIGYMFSRYDPNQKSLGLTDKNFHIFVEDETLDLKGEIIRKLKEYING